MRREEDECDNRYWKQRLKSTEKRKKKYTLKNLSRQTGLSIGFLSQLEKRNHDDCH